MKEYIKPEMNVTVFVTEDIITVSSETVDPAPFRFLKTMVNGNQGENYGNQDVSIFDK